MCPDVPWGSTGNRVFRAALLHDSGGSIPTGHRSESLEIFSVQPEQLCKAILRVCEIEKKAFPYIKPK